MSPSRRLFAPLLALATPSLVWAAGLRQPDNGATQTGMANAAVATVNDASAVAFNPAAMSRIEGTSLIFGFTLLAPKAVFTAAEDIPMGSSKVELAKGSQAETVAPASFVPHLYAAHRGKNTPLAVGIGLYVPFASGLEWAEDWAGRGYGVQSQVAGIAFNPNISWELKPGLSIAGGVSLIQTTLTARQVMRANVGDPNEDIGVELAADGQAYSANLALLWEALPMLSIGISYRTAARADMAGRVHFERPHPAYATRFPDQPITTAFRFPDLMNAGAGYHVSENWQLAGEIEWARNNVYRETVIHFERKLPLPKLIQRADWHNTFTYRLGTEFLASRRWDFRAGLAFEQTPVPDSSISPVSADSDRIVVAAGATYHWSRYRQTISLAMERVQFLERVVDQAAISQGAANLPGSYDTHVWGGSLTWSYAIP